MLCMVVPVLGNSNSVSITSRMLRVYLGRFKRESFAEAVNYFPFLPMPVPHL